MIRLAWPDVGAEEAAAAAEVLEGGQLTMGQKVVELEEELARVCGVEHAVAVSSGTAALHLAVLALGIGSTTAVFSVVNSVQLRPLTWPDSDRLVQLVVETPLGAASLVSIPQLNYWREYTRGFEAIAAIQAEGSPAGSGSPP